VCVVADAYAERAPQLVERCTVCDTYERYMGKPYWGHQNGCHPVGLKQVPVEVEPAELYKSIGWSVKIDCHNTVSYERIRGAHDDYFSRFLWVSVTVSRIH